MTFEAVIGDIALVKQKTEVLDLCVKGPLGDFSDLPDPCSNVNRRPILGEIIVMSILAAVAGVEAPNAIRLWAKNHESWLMRLFNLPGGIPSNDTFGHVLMSLRPAAFQACFERWLRRVSAKSDDGEREVIAIDGKTLRGNDDRVAWTSLLGERLVCATWHQPSAACRWREIE